MNNFEYLNQISQSTRPGKAAASDTSFPLATILKLAGIAIVGFILIMIFGLILGNATGKSRDLTKQIYTRATNLQSTISTYNPSLKSSRLRSIGSSLSSTLTNTNNQLRSYIDTTSSDKKTKYDPPEKILEEETALSGAFSTSLNNAKLNGILDRVYTTQVNLQVSLLISLGSELLARTKDEELINIITQMNSNLQVIETNLSNFSESS